jgi:hypothetical protein
MISEAQRLRMSVRRVQMGFLGVLFFFGSRALRWRVPGTVFDVVIPVMLYLVVKPFHVAD